MLISADHGLPGSRGQQPFHASMLRDFSSFPLAWASMSRMLSFVP